MKILFLNHNVAWSGGTFFRAFYFARYLTNRGHECTVLTISKGEKLHFRESVVDGVRVVETPDILPGIGRTGWDPWDTFRRILWVLRRKKEFDLVHALDSRPAVILPAIALKRIAKLPLVMDWADWWGRGGLIHERGYGLVDKVMEPVETWFEEHFRKEADATTVISTQLRERAVRLGVRRETILLLPQGCESHKFQQIDMQTARKTLRLPASSFIVGYLGKLIATDQPFLADTIRAVGDRIPGFQVHHIGKPIPDAPEDLLQDGRLVQVGKVPPEMLNIYLCACNAFILPLRDTLGNRARWPSKINDYLLAGRPVMATRVGDIADYFEKYHIGLLAEPQAGDLAEKLVQLYQCDDSVQMGENALRLAENELSWENLIKNLESLYLGMDFRHKAGETVVIG